MAAPFGYGVWVWLRNNPLAQGAAMAVGAWAIFWGWLRLRDRRQKVAIEQELELKSERAAREVVQTAREKSHEIIREAQEARDSIPSATPSDKLPKRVQNVLFRDD